MKVEKIVKELDSLKGVEGIVLGGSLCRGEADDLSDTDIGIYYDPEHIEFRQLEGAIQRLDDTGEASLFLPGSWGPWVNGGAWTTMEGKPVDFILRETKRVEQTIKDCLNGHITISDQSGHPFGFVNSIYAAEVNDCQIVWESPEKPVSALKGKLISRGAYPPEMRQATIDKFLFEADFSIHSSRKALLKGDLNYASGAFFKAACAWVQVIFALNEKFLMNEKGGVHQANKLAVKPTHFKVRVNQVYHFLAEHNPGLACLEIESLQREIGELAEPYRKDFVKAGE
ncbi:Hypothetical protein Tpal_2422 [Trichococcus palustris]|uniref:Polymerase nucleotidyl transferase domain-containing protein n=1 Tax=Trichococcus palustris TaxID=140314 RepID=A0A143YW42_9LACT|nr:nucleotidyltransferase domain-containing protein [Trichococcus palustris]CZQ99800.1 Hypothetical protein Tpal_2422 [Trichococcus palustris]SFK86786.1 Nucleotidyltransferase domain-containing protein [Trichococcus palustris]